MIGHLLGNIAHSAAAWTARTSGAFQVQAEAAATLAHETALDNALERAPYAAWKALENPGLPRPLVRLQREIESYLSAVRGIPVLITREPYPWARTPAQKDFRKRLGAVTEETLSGFVDIDLREAVPHHFLSSFKGAPEGLAHVNGVRIGTLLRLEAAGWDGRCLPTQTMLIAALFLYDEYLRTSSSPIVTQPVAENGAGRILIDGHHRLAALVSLVADGYLPPEILRRIPMRTVPLGGRTVIAAARESGMGPEELSLSWSGLFAFDRTYRNRVAAAGLSRTVGEILDS